MIQNVTVRFGEGEEYRLCVHEAETAGLTAEAAHRWLDAELAKGGDEGFNPVGKALAADKVLFLVKSAGPEEFKRNSAWARELARTVAVLFGRHHVTVDVAGGSVGY